MCFCPIFMEYPLLSQQNFYFSKMWCAKWYMKWKDCSNTFPPPKIHLSLLNGDSILERLISMFQYCLTQGHIVRLETLIIFWINHIWDKLFGLIQKLNKEPEKELQYFCPINKNSVLWSAPYNINFKINCNFIIGPP